MVVVKHKLNTAVNSFFTFVYVYVKLRAPRARNDEFRGENMNVCVSYVYWMLLFTTVASSALLFIIVASENTQNSKFIGPDRNQPESYAQKENVNFSEHSQDQFDSESEKKSQIKISPSMKSNIRKENDQDIEDPVSTNYDINYDSEESKLEEEIEILKDSLTQQPNLSYGISDGGQPVVVTLVDTTASLQDLATDRADFRSQRSVEGNASAMLVDDDQQQQQTLKSDDFLHLSQVLEANGTNESDVVVVVRAERKSIEDESARESGNAKDVADTESLPKTTSEELQQLPKSSTPVSDLNDSAARARLTGSGDDSAAAMLDSLVTAGPSDSHEEIPSFNEWAQKRLEEAEKKKAHPNVSVQTATGSPGRNVGNMRMRSKNYASPDCGAKIVAANPEARSARSVLVSTRDEYMLNTCTTRVWFVVELCEAIQAKKIELANFELFSSVPKDISVYVSDRFPTRDWSNVGQFTARDERDIQSFSLQPQLFGKFVKIELHSHYGTEHFCPISLFRAYGASELEVLETETETDAQTDGQKREASAEGSTAIGSDAENDDEDDEDNLFDDDDEAASDRSGNLFGSARDAVLSLVRKAAEVLAKSGDLKPTNNITKIQESIRGDVLEDATLDDCSTPVYNVTCRNCSDDRFARVFQLISCKENFLDSLLRVEFVRKTLIKSHLCSASFGFDILDYMFYKDGNKGFKDSDDVLTKYYIQAHFFSALFSSDYIIALCNVLISRGPEVNVSHQEPKYLDKTFNETAIDQDNQLPLDAEDDEIVVPIGASEVSISDNYKTKVETPILELNLEVVTEPHKLSENFVTQIKPTKTTVPNDDLKLQPITVKLEPNVGYESEDSLNEVNTETTSDFPVPDMNNKLPASSSKTEIEQESNSDAYPTKSQQLNIQPDASVSSTKAPQNSNNSQKLNEKNINNESNNVEIENEEILEGKSKVETAEQEVKSTSHDHLSFESFDFKDFDMDNVQNGQMNGGNKNDVSTTQQTASLPQKESVFLRLSNRIKVLERNMSLSSQYLEELSRRYKKQVEEMQRSLERAMTVMNEESRKGEERENRQLQEINTLRSQIDGLTKILNELVYEQKSWRISFPSLIQHTLFIIIDVILVILILLYCKRTDDDMDYFDVEEEVDQKSLVAKTTKRKNYEIVKQKCTQLMKKPKKRRPSEIASQVSGTYDQLMIENSMNINYIPKKDKRKKRRKDTVILRSSSIKETSSNDKTDPNSYNIKEMIPSRSASANDALNNRNDYLTMMDSQRQCRPESAPDNSISYFRDHQLQEQAQCDKKIQILTMDSYLGKSIRNDIEQIDNSEALNTSYSLEDDKFEEEKTNDNPGRVSFKKVPSPSFMKTALISRSRRLYLSGKNSKKRSESLDESMTTPLERRFDEKLDLLSEHDVSNNIGDEMNSRQSRNDRIEESDESRSSTATPTSSWKKKEKKSNGLKKMVRKFF